MNMIGYNDKKGMKQKLHAYVKPTTAMSTQTKTSHIIQLKDLSKYSSHFWNFHQ